MSPAWEWAFAFSGSGVMVMSSGGSRSSAVASSTIASLGLKGWQEWKLRNPLRTLRHKGLHQKVLIDTQRNKEGRERTVVETVITTTRFYLCHLFDTY